MVKGSTETSIQDKKLSRSGVTKDGRTYDEGFLVKKWTLIYTDRTVGVFCEEEGDCEGHYGYSKGEISVGRFGP